MPAAPPEDPYRLPRTIVPSRYDLTLRPDLDAATFAGTVRIEVAVVEATAEVVLNAVDLEIDEAAVVAGGDRHPATVELDAGTERLRLRLDGPLDPGPALVEIAFRGVLNDQLKGFYRSTFTDDRGEERVLATTQFEATDARRAFPCWDEPDLKASFAVTLEVSEDLLAISNAREVARQPIDGGLVRIHFAETIVMSTYLVAFVVGPLEATDPVPAAGVDLRIVHPPGKGDLTAYALEVGVFALEFLADWYDLPYPGDKLDLVAIPDFAFGAMENLGCVTFREVLLLVDPAAATQPDLMNVVDVISHELAHMWFGDLVTMRWWNGIWLNEAFATFMEMKTTDAFRPDWQRWVVFGHSRAGAMDTDALHSTRPVEFPVHSPEEAEGMFDVLTYEKGASVVRMLEQYLGEDRFREGIRHYLAGHRFGNTETTDLWDAIEEATGEPVRRIMDSWIFQGGFPVVTAERDGDDLVLGQGRFTYLPEAGGRRRRRKAPAWSVPILLGAGDGIERTLLEGDATTVAGAAGGGWAVVNRGGSGFYRVGYSDDLRGALTPRALEVLEPLERYQFLDDLWASALAGTTGAVEVLEVLAHFEAETDVDVWERIVGCLRSVERLVDDEAHEGLARLTRALVTPAYERLGPHATPGEDVREAELRAVLFATLGVVGEDPDARERAADLHRRYLKDRGSVDPALASSAASILARVGRPEDHERFLARFQEPADPQEEQRYLYLLGDFEDPGLYARTLDLSLGEHVRTQNAPYLVRRALTNRRRGEDGWRWLVAHWDEATTRFPSNSIARMLGGVVALDQPGLAAEVEDWLDTHPVPQGAKQVEQHREKLRVNLAFRQRETESLQAWLTAPTERA